MATKPSNTSLTRLEDVTPAKYKCTYGHCPSVFKMEDEKILIIGKKLPLPLAGQVAERIGEDEWAIIVDRELLSNI